MERALKNRKMPLKAALGILFFTSVAGADEVDDYSDYNTSFLRGNANDQALIRYLQSRAIPGIYYADIMVNGAIKSRRNVELRAVSENSDEVIPCLNADMLIGLGIDLNKIIEDGLLPKDALGQECINLGKISEYFSAEFRSEQLILDINVPQIYANTNSSGYVDPELWDHGINAAMINYSVNHNVYQRKYNGDKETTNSTYVGLKGGINLEMWRFRAEGNYMRASGQSGKLKRDRIYVERDITPLKGQLAIGDVFSDSQLFDSVRFRGVKIESDTAMLSPREQGYAPVVRGIAQSNATVEISQNGYVIYRTNVTPGPFEIADLHANGSNGDLVVTVTEADGSTSTFTQAFSSLPIMVREGSYQYSASFGKYLKYAGQNNLDYEPTFAAIKQVYGLTNNVTLFGGAQVSNNYQAYNVGVGVNTPIGAFSTDLTHSRSETNVSEDTTLKGYSLRALYGKTFTELGTSFTLAGYRYSTEDYRTFAEHIDERSDQYGRYFSGKQKNRFDANINQTLPGGLGSLYLSGSWADYWENERKRTDYRIGYSNSYKRLSYNLYYSRSKNNFYNSVNESDNKIMLTLSLNLDGKLPNVTSSISRDNNGKTAFQTGVNGYFTEDYNNHYSAYYNKDESHVSSGGLNVGTRRSFGNYSASYSQGQGFRSGSLNGQGSIVLHRNGVTFGQTIGETATLVEVPGVKAVSTDRDRSIKTDYRGYAIVPTVQPYRSNWLNLDTTDASLDVDFENTAKQVIPRRGSITKATFNVVSGNRVQFEISDVQGNRLPLGTEVFDDRGNLLGLLDPQGRVLVLVEERKGEIRVNWQNSLCTIPYTLKDKSESERFSRVKLSCQNPLIGDSVENNHDTDSF